MLSMSTRPGPTRYPPPAVRAQRGAQHSEHSSVAHVQTTGTKINPPYRLFKPLTCPCASAGAGFGECVGVKADFVPAALTASSALESWDWSGPLGATAAALLAASDGATLST